MTLVEAYVALGINVDESPSPEEARARWKALAKIAHPDMGGSDKAMAELNDALNVVLEDLGAPRVEPKCACLGFKRNPLCRARHEEPKVIENEEQWNEHERTEACVCRGFFRNPLCKAH